MPSSPLRPISLPPLARPSGAHWIALTRQVIFLIPLILIFPLFLGIDGVMYAGPIADSAAVVVALALVTREMKRMPHVDEPVAADTLV